MASSTFTNPEASSRELNRNKRSKNGVQTLTDVAAPAFDTVRWRSDSDQRIYASKLMNALSQVRPTVSSPFAGGKAVRETADRVLAVVAKGKTRWSKAILTGRLSLRLSQIYKRHKHKKPRVAGDNRLKKTAVKKRLPAFQKKVRVLSRLVPGCRKTSFPSLLEEAIDFIAAKQMQVRAMTLLSELLTPGGGDGDGGAASQL